MRLLLVLALAAIPARAHVVSMSTSEARLQGARLDFELRMPLYEAAHMAHPEAELFANVHFRAGGEATLLEHSCRADAGNLVCNAVYRFHTEPEQFDVQCTFAAVTVPNHVHLMRAIHGDKSEQAAFDASFTSMTIRFRPPTAFEVAARDAVSGFWRAASGMVQVLFLAALVLAARSRRELLLLAAMFFAGQAITAAAHLSMRLQVSARFVEAATALTIAYLAVEILLLPSAGQRWLIAGVLGLLHGMYFDMLLAAGDYGRTAFLTGAFAAESIIVLIFAMAARFGRRIPVLRQSLVMRAMASLLLATGLSWFIIRLKS